MSLAVARQPDGTNRRMQPREIQIASALGQSVGEVSEAKNQRIVIIGGGFAGVSLAQHLEQLVSPQIEIVLMRPEHIRTPNVHHLHKGQTA